MSFAGKVYVQFPETVNADEKYVFYSHGRIVEGNNPTPISQRWGKYEFPKIKKELSDSSYNLIAYHRPKDTNPKDFARRLADDVNSLIKQGVKPENITLVGFSRGGQITILTSSYLKSKQIRVVLLASCAKSMKNRAEFQVYGNIYSVYETSDMFGSCQLLIDQSENVDSFEEISISTGLEHGAFFKPMKEWLQPVKNWIKQSHN